MSETGPGQPDGLNTPALMVTRVLNDAQRAFGQRADQTTLEQCTERAVATLWTESIKVRTFVPVLALRYIRDMLEQAEQSRAERAGEA